MRSDHHVIDEVRRVPPVAVSTTSTLATKTGSWKYIHPVYRDLVAPCNQACPVGVDIEGYLNFLREGRIAEARDLLLRENPLPAVTGRVCDHPCERGCNRREFDSAVSIHAVERMLGDLAIESPPRLEATRRAARKETVAVVGSGPAGLSCAYHLARSGYRVTVLEAADAPGGMLRLGIPEYRLPRHVLEAEIDRIRTMGVDFRCGVKLGRDVPWSALPGQFDAVFVATGAHQSRTMGVEGESGPGVRRGLEFLNAVSRGERPDLGRRVVVVGGGNTAMDCARTALRLGAEVVVLYRRTRAEMPAIQAEIDEAQREGVEFVFLAAPRALVTEDGHLAGVHCDRMRLGPPDASGRRRPVLAPGEGFTLPADTVLTAIGEGIEADALPPGIHVHSASVSVDEWGLTSLPSVFAGGDITDTPRTVAHALGAGKRAAIGIDRHLRARAGEALDDVLAAEALRFGPAGNLSMTRWRRDDPVDRVSPVNEVVGFADLNPSSFARVARHDDRHLDGGASSSGFAEVNQGLARDTALAEAGRCLSCGVCNQCDLCLILCPDVAISRSNGHYDIALDYCKGCGICAEECPRGAVSMVR